MMITKFAGFFELGTQSDAHEFLHCLIEDLLRASCGYADSPQIKFQKETLVSRVFKGQMERQIICIRCKNFTKITEDFMDL